MSEPLLTQPPVPRPPLSRGKATLVAIVFYVGGILVVVLADHLGKQLAGDVGGWIGWGVAFVAVCVVGALVALRITDNPGSTLLILLAVMPGMTAGGKVEDSLRELEWGGWAKATGFAVFIAVYLLWATIIGQLVKRRQQRASV